MLAGRKLLLADDSITIQKVVALTFADEGVEVVTVSDGQEAIEQLGVITPDIVLADVFMPEVNGYEVCRYIKQNAKLKHIPVMLLVGSFEPFDEAEARKVGADDILTKPFQSIRRLIDKVGGLVGSKPAAEATTAELPPVEEEAPEPQKLSTEQLEITTADTQRLTGYPAHEPASALQESDYSSYEPVSEMHFPKDMQQENFRESQIMDSPSNEARNESTQDPGDVLLDLGDVSRTSAAASDDFVLDLDLDEPQSALAAESAAGSGTHSFVEPRLSRSDAPRNDAQTEPPLSDAWMDTSELAQKWKPKSPRSTSSDLRSKGEAGKRERVKNVIAGVASTPGPSGSVSLDQLSPEVIDAIARRAVEQLSAQVVEAIAWEVVPQLAELLIKRKLEENESQPK
ncbi:MAG: PleD family two-component system response regulator [Pyrinomonadaceae bacterium]